MRVGFLPNISRTSASSFATVRGTSSGWSGIGNEAGPDPGNRLQIAAFGFFRYNERAMKESDEREEFLKHANVAVLATVDRRGRAHAAPVWYLYEDGVFIISTGRGSQKHRNIETHPEVALVADRRTLPYYAVMIQGAAEIGPPLSQEARLRMAVRYLGEEMGRGYIAWQPDVDAVTIRLRPRKFMEYGGVAGRRESR